jgi:hypothetical protein
LPFKCNLQRYNAVQRVLGGEGTPAEGGGGGFSFPFSDGLPIVYPVHPYS